MRPSLDMICLKSGYTDGKASIIPHSAWFRVLTRAGPGHRAAELKKKIIDHIKANTPWGAKLEFTALDRGNAAYSHPDDQVFAIG